MKEQFILERLNGIKKQVNAIEKHINTPRQQRPEPKFAVGDMTDKGAVKMTCWSITHKHYHVWTDRESGLHEDELTAVPKPSIKITLFKVVDGNVETETNSSNDNADKDFMAELAFQNGYCAILVEQDGSKSMEYCKEIMALDGWNGLYLSDDDEIYVTTNTIQRAINHPKFLVEQNGVKMRAYRMKDNIVKVEFEGHDARDWSLSSNNHLITALGFNPDNIMPYILHGKG